MEHSIEFQTLLLQSRLLRGCRGTLLAHETYDEKATGSAVTYASMIFHRQARDSAIPNSDS